MAGCSRDGGSEQAARPAVDGNATTAPADSPESDRLAVVGVLRRYRRAIAGRDVGSLQASFADSIRRRAPGPGGCVTSVGRVAVVSDFTAQFRARPRPRMIGRVSSRAVSVTGDTAHARLEARSPKSRRAPLQIRLMRGRTGWQIDRISSPCNGGPTPEAAPPPGKKQKAPRPASAGQGQRVVHPRPGCTVVLPPQGRSPRRRAGPRLGQEPGKEPPQSPRSGRGGTPDSRALKRLCQARKP